MEAGKEKKLEKGGHRGVFQRIGRFVKGEGLHPVIERPSKGGA